MRSKDITDSCTGNRPNTTTYDNADSKENDNQYFLKRTTQTKGTVVSRTVYKNGKSYAVDDGVRIAQTIPTNTVASSLSTAVTAGAGYLIGKYTILGARLGKYGGPVGLVAGTLVGIGIGVLISAIDIYNDPNLQDGYYQEYCVTVNCRVNSDPVYTYVEGIGKQEYLYSYQWVFAIGVNDYGEPCCADISYSEGYIYVACGG